MIAAMSYGRATGWFSLGVMGVQVAPPFVVDSNSPRHIIQPIADVAKSRRNKPRSINGQKTRSPSPLVSPPVPVSKVVNDGGMASE